MDARRHKKSRPSGEQKVVQSQSGDEAKLKHEGTSVNDVKVHIAEAKVRQVRQRSHAKVHKGIDKVVRHLRGGGGWVVRGFGKVVTVVVAVEWQLEKAHKTNGLCPHHA